MTRLLRALDPGSVGDQMKVMVLLLLLVAGLMGISTGLRGDLNTASTWLSFEVLLVAMGTLWFAWPTPAKILVFPQTELGVADVMFLVYPEDEAPGRQAPRDVNLDVHVAVANVGGRKAVVSGISIEEFLDANNRPINSMFLSTPVIGVRYRQWEEQSSVDMSKRYLAETVYPPFVIEPDDVITIRLRSRGGIDWSEGNWDLHKLRDAADALDRPVAKARVQVIFRHGDRAERLKPLVELRTLGQTVFVEAISSATDEFSIMPDIQQRSTYDTGISGFPIAR